MTEKGAGRIRDARCCRARPRREREVVEDEDRSRENAVLGLRTQVKKTS
jgi:hypothetical protein